MIVNASGGGAGLNFKVVGGTTQPSKPKENTIWVNTAEEITSWMFAAENPYIKSEDFYDKGEVKAGYYLKSTGVETASSDTEICTIELPSTAISFTITAASVETSTVCHVFYDADGELLSSVLRQTGRNTFAIPSGAASVRVSFRNEDTKEVQITYEDGVVEGEVWIKTGLKRSVSFNALKKNGITVYPIEVKQYIGGAWTRMTAEIYQNSAWQDFAQFIYKNGDQYTSLTGGWGLGSGTVSGGKGGFAANEDHLSFTGKADSYWGFGTTLKAVDLTNFSTLNVYGDGGGTFGVGTAQDGNFSASTSVGSALQDYSVDISGLSGSHYVKFKIGGLNTLRAYEVWLE